MVLMKLLKNNPNSKQDSTNVLSRNVIDFPLDYFDVDNERSSERCGEISN